MPELFLGRDVVAVFMIGLLINLQVRLLSLLQCILDSSLATGKSRSLRLSWN
jgi:hypothetical protein